METVDAGDATTPPTFGEGVTDFVAETKLPTDRGFYRVRQGSYWRRIMLSPRHQFKF